MSQYERREPSIYYTTTNSWGYKEVPRWRHAICRVIGHRWAFLVLGRRACGRCGRVEQRLPSRSVGAENERIERAKQARAARGGRPGYEGFPDQSQPPSRGQSGA